MYISTFFKVSFSKGKQKIRVFRQNGRNSNLSNLSRLMSLLSHKQPGDEIHRFIFRLRTKKACRIKQQVLKKGGYIKTKIVFLQ